MNMKEFLFPINFLNKVKFKLNFFNLCLAFIYWFLFRMFIGVTGKIIFKEDYTFIIIYYLLSIPIFIGTMFIGIDIDKYEEESRKIELKNVLISIATILIYRIMALLVLMPLLIKLPGSQELNEVINITLNDNFVYKYGYLCLYSPIIEEMFFRGIILKGISNKHNPILAIIISSILFGMSHLNFQQGIFSIILGIILGAVYYKSRSLYLTIGCHMLNNVLSIL